MELHVVRPIFILLLWGFTLGLKADDLSVIRQKYIESILSLIHTSEPTRH